MADDTKPADARSFWSTLPGLLTGIAAVLTAATGLVALWMKSDAAPKPDPTKAEVSRTDAAAAAAPRASQAAVAASPAATGVVEAPAVQAAGFRGAIVTLNDGSQVKLAGTVSDQAYGEQLRLLDGRFVQFDKLRSFEVLSFRAGAQEGQVRLTLNDGSALVAGFSGFILNGTTELGAFSQGFERVKRVDFVR